MSASLRLSGEREPEMQCSSTSLACKVKTSVSRVKLTSCQSSVSHNKEGMCLKADKGIQSELTGCWMSVEGSACDESVCV